jgi:hypothetical protein
VTSQTALAASQSHDDTSHTEGVEDICFIYLILCGHIDINLGYTVVFYFTIVYHISVIMTQSICMFS